MSRNFDYRPVDADPSLRDRLRGVARSPRILVAATIATLLVLAGVAPLAFIVVTWSPTDWITPVVCSALALLGAFVWADALGQTGDGNNLAAFAKANGLELIEGTSAGQYAGSLFRDGEHMVEVAVRTRGKDFVEVGDSFPLDAVTMREVRALRTGRGTVESRQPVAFLRARLAGGAARPAQDGARIPGELVLDLQDLLGDHTVEITRTELTVFGSEPLGGGEPARLRESFRLIDALAAANARDAPSELNPAAPPDGPRRRPLVIVLGTLALVLVVPIVLAVVMSSVVPSGGVPGGPGVLIGVVATTVVVAITSAGVRFLLVGRRRARGASKDEPDPRSPGR